MPVRVVFTVLYEILHFVDTMEYILQVSVLDLKPFTGYRERPSGGGSESHKNLYRFLPQRRGLKVLAFIQDYAQVGNRRR